MAIEIYSTDTDSGLVSVLSRNDGNFESVAQVAVGNAPRGGVKFTADGRGYVCNTGGDTLSEIDVILHRETGRIRVGLAPRGLGIIPGDRFALVSNSGSNTVSVVDLGERRELGQIAVGRDPRHLAITKDGSFAYVAIWGSQYVAKLSLSSLLHENALERIHEVREVRRISLRPDSFPYSVAISPKGDAVYVANTQSSVLAIISTETDEVSHEVDLGFKGARAVAFSPDGKLAYVSVEYSGEVVVVDTSTKAISERFYSGNAPRGIALDPTGSTLFVADFERSGGGSLEKQPFANSEGIRVLNLTLLKERAANAVRTLPAGKGSCSVAVLNLESLKR